MVRNHRWLVAVAAWSLVAGACKKDEAKQADKVADKSGDKAADKTADKAAEKAPDPGMAKAANNSPAAPNANAGDLSLLPVDSEIVMGLNWSQLQKSDLFKQYVQPMMMKNSKELDKFKAACGFDPLDAVQNISIGLKNVGDTATKPAGAIVVHGLDKTKSMACMDKAKDEAKKEGTELTVDGDVVLMKDKDGNTTGFTFINDSTVLLVIAPGVTKDAVVTAAKGGGTLATSPAFTEMYSKLNTSDSLWMLMNGSSKAFDKMPMGVKMKAVFGSINVTDGLTMDFRARLESPDKATEMANMGKTQAAQAAAMFDKLDISADGSDVRVQVVLSNQKLQQLVKQFGGMLGAMGGAGGAGMTGATP